MSNRWNETVNIDEHEGATNNVSNYLWSDPPDETKWADCVHCGMCLESCPTYMLTGQEQHSPRGRVHLIKSVAEGKLEVNEQFAVPIFACLDCRACETACPASVQVGGLIEEARGQICQAMPLSGMKGTMGNFVLQNIFPNHKRINRLGSLLKFYQKSGLQKVAQKTVLKYLFPEHLAEMEAVLPEQKGKPVREKYKHEDAILPEGEVKREVSFLTGCIMDAIFSDINEATIKVLTRNGNSVTIPQNQTCCGALHVHAGDRETGRKLAKQNIEAFSNAETVIVNSAGCGAMLKEYPELFRHDPEWKEKAEQFSKKVKDISEHLYETGFEPPKAEIETTVTYHDACHLAHAQGIRKEPREILESIPGVKLVPMPNSDQCCGSAGVYNITNPEMANAVLDKKMENVPDEVEIISMGNPGCMLQMALGVKKYGRNEKIVHTVELLHQAYEKEAMLNEEGKNNG